MFLVAVLLLNSPIGRNVDELVTDWVVQSWHRLRIHVFATLVSGHHGRVQPHPGNDRAAAVHGRRMAAVPRGRRPRRPPSSRPCWARSGSSSTTVIRFCVKLLIEPQINPIKHFPVVTVSHKILLPLDVPLIHVLQRSAGHGWANAVGPTIMLLTPGMFGFLVWELKENWRLYAANRPPNLGAIGIGHHGETMLQFLQARLSLGHAAQAVRSCAAPIARPATPTI